jgi:hypothetical protein
MAAAAANLLQRHRGVQAGRHRRRPRPSDHVGGHLEVEFTLPRRVVVWATRWAVVSLVKLSLRFFSRKTGLAPYWHARWRRRRAPATVRVKSLCFSPQC